MTNHPAGSATGFDLSPLIQRLRAQARSPFGPEGFALLDEAAEALARATPQHPDDLSNAEFLSKRLARVAKLAGVTMPDGTHEQIAEVAGTILGDIARHLEKAATPQHSVTEQDERNLFEAWVQSDGRRSAMYCERNRNGSKYSKPWLNNWWTVWQAARAQPLASTAATQPEQASELPPLPEMESLADIEYAQRTPDDWDADYRATWQKLQVAERNKMQWRAHALQLRAALAIPASTAASEQQAGADERALAPIEYDEAMQRSYLPLPGGWEVQTKGKGSTFRIAHASSGYRWQVLDDKLHEVLEALARDIRNAFTRDAAAPGTATTAADQHTAKVGEDGEYDLYRDGRLIGTILFRDDAVRIMQALKATAADQQGDDARDAARYRFVKSMSKETLLVWRGMYGCTDEAVDAAMAAPATSGGGNG